MNTPRSDKAWKAFKESSNAQHIRSESCRLETELAEVKAKLEKCRTAMIETLAECSSLPNFVVKKLSEALDQTK